MRVYKGGWSVRSNCEKHTTTTRRTTLRKIEEPVGRISFSKKEPESQVSATATTDRRDEYTEDWEE